MENLLKSVIKKEYIGIQKNITEIEKRDLLAFCQYILCILYLKKFNDSELFLILFPIFKMNLEVSELDIDILLQSSNAYKTTLKLFILFKEQSFIEKKINLIFNILLNSPGMLQTKIRHSEKNVPTVSKIINEVTLFINSFWDVKFIEQLNLRNILFNHREIHQWEVIQTEELESRLLNLVDYFGMKSLLFFNIKLISNKDYCVLPFNQKVDFYKTVICKLKEGINIIRKKIENYNILKGFVFNMESEFSIAIKKFQKIEKLR